MPTVLDPDAEAPAQAEVAEVAERQPLLASSSASSDDRGELEEAPKSVPPPIPPSIITRLCVSHFLSAWNSRLFEFGSVLFIASIYPGTLLPVSVYALVRAAAAIILSPAIGVIIDKVDRLVVVRASIVGERVAIGVSCAVFLILKGRENEERGVYHGLFAVTVVLAGVEKLCAIMNSVSVKRDWVVELTESNDGARRDVNAKMRRIDLACKLLSPFLIASIDAASTRWAIWTTLLMTCLSVPAEYLFIKQIYVLIPRLRRQSGEVNPAVSTSEESETENNVTSPAGPRFSIFVALLSTLRHILPFSSVARYTRSPAFLPSLAYAFLHLTVLSFSGRMIAFLLAVGYDPLQVGIARVVSTVAELSATWISPWATNRLGSVRLAGVWSISWQTGWLTLGVVAFLVAGGILGVTGLVVGVIMSRIGLWGFDLAVHNIIQDEVESDNRGAFSTAEASTQNLFELASYISTIIFSRPSQFQWPMLMTMVSAYAACVVYFSFVWRKTSQASE